MPINKAQVVLLPYATPHILFGDEWGAFHPMALIDEMTPRKSRYDEMVDWSGYGGCAFATRLSHTVIATIPPKTVPAGMTLDYLLSKFVNVQNILSEIERVETDKKSVADQIGVAFDVVERATSMTVIMPYQYWSGHDAVKSELKNVSADFAFTHPMKNLFRVNIPECVVMTPDTQNDDGSEVTCKDVATYKDLDPMLRGPYTRVVSMFEITRQEYEAFRASSDYPDLGKFLKVKLQGKTGTQVNTEGHGFI